MHIPPRCGRGTGPAPLGYVPLTVCLRTSATHPEGKSGFREVEKRPVRPAVPFVGGGRSNSSPIPHSFLAEEHRHETDHLLKQYERWQRPVDNASISR